MAGHQKNEKKESDTAFVFEKTLMILLVSAAVVLDFKTWRIPNWLVLIGMETGIFVTIQREGWRMGGIQVVLGIVLPVALLFLLYQFGFLGAGDIKLFAAGLPCQLGKQVNPWCIYRNGGLADRSVFVSVWWGFVFAVYGKECMDPMAEASKTKTAPKE